MENLARLLFMVYLACVSVQGFRNSSCRKPKRAKCVIQNFDIDGVITLTQDNPNAPVILSGKINGLDEGLHGFHVHEFGDLSEGCGTAGYHYNPYHFEYHGGPDSLYRHVGDLGNIEADDEGVANINISDYQLKLCGPLSIIGRSLDVHEKEDDLGRGGDEESLRSGNAGARIGCCVIGLSK